MKYKKIYSKEQYNNYCEKHEELTMTNYDANIEEIELIEVLIDEYESRTMVNSEIENPVEILKYLLEENNISNSQLAQELGVSRQLISEILKFKRNISKSMILKLSNRFKLNPSLFTKQYQLRHDGRRNKQPA